MKPSNPSSAKGIAKSFFFVLGSLFFALCFSLFAICGPVVQIYSVAHEAEEKT